MKGLMAGPPNEEKNDETDFKLRAEQIQRRRAIGVVPHSRDGPGPHTAGIGGAPERAGLAGKHHPGAPGAQRDVRALRRNWLSRSRSRHGPGSSASDR